MTSIEVLRALVAQVNGQGEPPLDEVAITQVEEALGVRLPEDYRRFLAEVSDGGIGPGQEGLYPLCRAAQDRSRAREPFPHSSEDARGAMRVGEYAFLGEDDPPGTIVLAHDDGTTVYLVVTTEQAGTVWLGHVHGACPAYAVVEDEVVQHRFHTWYADVLRARLALPLEAETAETPADPQAPLADTVALRAEIAAASAGSVVTVPPGRYSLNAPLLLTEGIRLDAAPDSVVLEATHDGFAIEVSGRDITFDGLEFSRGGIGGRPGSSFTVSSCAFWQCETGVEVDAAEASVTSCRFVGCTTGVRFTGTARGAVRRCELQQSLENDLWIGAEARSQIEDNLLSGSAQHGIVLSDGAAVMERNEIVNAGKIGVHIQGGQHRLQHNLIHRAGDAGLVIHGGRSTIRGNFIAACPVAVHIEGRLHTSVLENVVWKSSYDGIVAVRGEVELAGNHCAHNRQHGLWLSLAPTQPVRDNVCYHNALAGIDLEYDVSTRRHASQALAVELTYNRCFRNGKTGVRVGRGAVLVSTRNSASHNGIAGLRADGIAHVAAHEDTYSNNGLFGVLELEAAHSSLVRSLFTDNGLAAVGAFARSLPTGRGSIYQPDAARRTLYAAGGPGDDGVNATRSAREISELLPESGYARMLQFPAGAVPQRCAESGLTCAGPARFVLAAALGVPLVIPLLVSVAGGEIECVERGPHTRTVEAHLRTLAHAPVAASLEEVVRLLLAGSSQRALSGELKACLVDDAVYLAACFASAAGQAGGDLAREDIERLSHQALVERALSAGPGRDRYFELGLREQRELKADLVLTALYSVWVEGRSQRSADAPLPVLAAVTEGRPR